VVEAVSGRGTRRDEAGRCDQTPLRLRAELTQPGALWSYPIEAVSNSEGGFERTYQGVCLTLLWPLRLAPGESTSFGLTWRQD